MSTSLVRASVEIARQVRSQMQILGYVRPERGDASTSSGCRDWMVSGYAGVRILGPNRFEASFTRQQFTDSLRRDLFDGAIRVKQLEATVCQLLEARAVTAWALTTCYYASFFSSIELLRCSGIFVSYFDEDAVAKITQKAVAPVGSKIEDGTYHGIASYNTVEDEVRITFAKRNIKHHQFTWYEIRGIIERSGRGLTGLDGLEQKCLEKFIGMRTPYWPSPSDVRNEWNYADAGLWGKHGEARGNEFRKLAQSRPAAAGWARKCRMRSSPEAQASSLAFVMSVLVGALENVIGAALPTSDEKRIIASVTKWHQPLSRTNRQN